MRIPLLLGCFFVFCSDGIIIGVSKMNHLVSNLEACEEGPLDERKKVLCFYLSYDQDFVCIYMIFLTAPMLL